MNCVAHKQLCTQANMYTSTQAQKPLSTTSTEASPKCLHLVAGTASLCESGDSDGKWFDARQVLYLLRFLIDALNFGSGFQRRKQQFFFSPDLFPAIYADEYFFLLKGIVHNFFIFGQISYFE